MQSHFFIRPYYQLRALYIFLLLLLCLYASQTEAQLFKLMGKVKENSSNYYNIPYVSIVLLRKEDSALTAFTRTYKDGSFLIKQRLERGAYIILVTHPLYEPVYRTIDVNVDTTVELMPIILNHKADSLETVIVTPRDLRAHFRGDTLEYNTRNIRMKPNAIIEELLQRLPGIEIMPDGTITINGQKVERLLVDGKDIFGSDPTMITRNLTADMIDRVQVLDKKSEQTEFSGVQDGKTTKTINLRLKEESKKGYFGKMGGGAGGPDGYYSANAMVGSLANKYQLMAFGSTNNIGLKGLNGSLSAVGSNGSSYDPMNTSAGLGIPRSTISGVHFGNLWNNNDNEIIGDYQLRNVFTQPSTALTVIQYLGGDTIYRTNQYFHSSNRSNNQNLALTYNNHIDTLNYLHLYTHGSYGAGNNQFNSMANSYFNDRLSNSSLRTILSGVESKDFRIWTFWQHMSRQKKDRMIVINFDGSKQDDKSDGYLKGLNAFYQTNAIVNDTTDQRKFYHTIETSFRTVSSLIEPLGSDFKVGLTYIFSYANMLQLLDTYDNNKGKYDIYIDSLSNQQRDISRNQWANLNIERKTRRFLFDFSFIAHSYSYLINNQFTGSNIRFHGLSVEYLLTAKFVINPRQIINLNYSTNILPPPDNLLQQVKDNNDPLHISIGNPGLKPGYNQILSLDIQSLKAITTNVKFVLNSIANNFSSRTYIDSLGRQVTQAVNVNGTLNGIFDASASKQVKSINLAFNTQISYNRSLNYINSTLSHNDLITAGSGFTIAQFASDIYNFKLSTHFIYSYSKSSVNSLKVGYWAQDHYFKVGFFPVRTWEVNNSLVYTWRQKSNAFENNASTVIWNAYINKDLLHNRLTLRWEINNILNQNVGISRSNALNIITDSQTNILGRYWIFSAIYHFNHRRKSD